MVMNSKKKLFIKLEGGGKHLRELPRSVNELGENWRHLFRIPRHVAHPVAELVSESQPVFFYQRLKQKLMVLHTAILFSLYFDLK